MNIRLVVTLLAVVLSACAFAAPSGTGRTLAIAHRGARSVAPENTLEAFRIGLDRFGADMIELDVHLSRDGVPVVVHDDTLERCSDVAERFPDRKPWRVGDFTAVELLSLDAGSWFVANDPFGQIAAGAVPETDLARFRSGKVRIPTLKQVLALVAAGRAGVNIELKNFPMYYEGLAETVVAEVRAAGLEARTVFSSFDHEILARLRKIAPEIERAALCDQPVYPLGGYLVDQLGVSGYNPGSDVLGIGSLAWHRDGAVRDDVIRIAHAAGLKVCVWTVNDPAEMEALIKAGVDGIFTDFPQRMTRRKK
ncbi:MAG TPA: glycerophosphodiester phosphodiesterase family protein [Candidatus Ozemobacteraceae bacterium]|nr:glycerophosphodiester phosphodiesterase family protein [Candidatus Ozemobacteraceae bacterium]